MQILDRLPRPVASWLRTRFGKHLSRFAGVALLSLATTEAVLSIAYLIIGTGGTATLLGWFAGAAVSYVLSRKAWERKGRPDLLRETVPFCVISACTAVVLTTAGHLAGEYAKDHHLARIAATVVVAGTVLVANVVTFIIRFVIFHYVLFADRSGAPDPPAAESLAPATARAESGKYRNRPRNAGNRG
jgi:putative flippase GtrA